MSVEIPPLKWHRVDGGYVASEPHRVPEYKIDKGHEDHLAPSRITWMPFVRNAPDEEWTYLGGWVYKLVHAKRSVQDLRKRLYPRAQK